MTCMISPDRGMPGSVPASRAVFHLAEHGAALDRVTLSTDGNGSTTEPDGAGGWLPYQAHMDSLLAEIRALVAAGMSLADAVALGSSHPAEALGLSGKGRIDEGTDADLVLLDPDLAVRDVFARGRQLVRDGQPVVLGRYERRAS
jgi:beta-aspartyl-dipeptidase (metallo-type)